jgi:glucose-6-phosphate isomerase
MSTDALLKQLAADRLPARIWRKDTAVFADAEAPATVRDAIGNRLGWLAAPSDMTAYIETVTGCAATLRRDGLTDVYLLGMGGSSLCAEVLRDVLGSTDAARLVVLDTTDERAVLAVTEELVPEKACFLVASKSGTTLEVTALERYFRAQMTQAVGEVAGSHFIAITDPGTPLVEHAAANRYRQTFINPPDIGGRYSALSLFGLLPAAITGVPLETLLASGASMADQCRRDDAGNPGLALGAFLGGWAKAGRDKLTVLAPASLAPLGTWIEQLVAESTGKRGRGVLPVVGEPPGAPHDYGKDRAFVALLTRDASDVRVLAGALHSAGHPVFGIETNAVDLGGEFFRWEFATAVAGAVLGLNPFDEPDVRSAKERTQAQLDALRAGGQFRTDPPFEPHDGYARREYKSRSRDVAHRAGRYVAILDYLPVETGRAQIVDRLRANLRRRTGLATTHGIGPRYLHSTGQYHKGGPNTGVFLLITAADQTATPIPEAGYTFSALKQAQAWGDFDALVAADRSVIHYHIEDPDADFSAELEKVALGLG